MEASFSIHLSSVSSSLTSFSFWIPKAVSATSNNAKLVHWPLMGGLLHLVQRGGDWAGPQPAQALLAVPIFFNCNSPPINGQCTHHCIPLLCGFNVAIKGLIVFCSHLDINVDLRI